MVQILRYRDFSDSHFVIEADAGKTIEQAAGALNWENHIIIVNGKKENERYKIKEGDCIIIRSVPKEAFTLIAGIVAVVAAVGMGVYAGVQSYKARKEAEAAQKEMEKLKNRTKDDITNIPYLKGASNTIATGKTQPYIIGRHLFTPYILNGGGNNYKGYHTIGGELGEDSFYNVVLEGGFNKQIIESISFDDVQVANLLQSTPQENNSAYPRFSFNSNSDFASNDSFIEIAQDGKPFENSFFNTKIVEQEVSDQLKKKNANDYSDLLYTLELNARSCDVCIMFNGLYATNDEGTKIYRKVTVIPEYSLDYAEILAQGGDTTKAHFVQFPHTFMKRRTVSKTIGGVKTASYAYTTTVKGTDKNVKPDNAFIMGMIYQWEGGAIDVDGKTIDVRWANGKDYTGGVNPKTTFRIGYGLVNSHATTEGDKYSSNYRHVFINTYRVYITAYYDTGIPQETIYYDEVDYITSFSFKQTKQLRFEAHHDFAFSDVFTRDENGDYKQRRYPITIRLRCDTNKVTSGNEVSDCYTEYIHSYCIDVEKSKNAGSFVDEKIITDNEAAKSTLIGVHVKGTLVNEDKIKKINVITNGIAPIPTYNEESKLYEWNISEKAITSNPASWLVEVLTSETHAASKVSLNEIDLQSFGELYDYCKDNSFEINKVLTASTKKSEVLAAILTVCHAALYQNIYGKIAVAIDNEKENAIALLNEQNIISFDWEKEIALDVDGVRVKYIDSDSDFQENSFVTLFGDKEYNEDSVLREISLDGITNNYQACRHAHYIMANDKLRPIKATAKIGREGIYFTPFSKIFIQHPSLKIGLGNATIKNIIVDENDIIIGVDLYDAIELDTEYEHYIVIQCVGDDYCAPISRKLKDIEKVIEYKESPLRDHNGEKIMLSDGSPLIVSYEKTKVFVTSLYFETGIALNSPVIPHKGDILSFGYELETVSRAFTISAIEPDGNAGYTLKLVDYNENIFDFDATKIPDYNQLVTTRRPKTGAQVRSIEDIQEYERVLIQEISTEKIITNSPKYLGLLSALPENPSVNDWFTAKTNFSTFKAGRVYKYTGEQQWELLKESESKNNKEFMAALNDILSTTSATGYFSAIFANALITNEAFINKLAASIITLQQDSNGAGGVIRSANFLDSNGKETGEGWQIDYNGNAKFNNGTFRGHIEANSGVFTGIVNANSGVFDSVIIQENSIFKGEILAGPLRLLNETPSTETKTYTTVVPQGTVNGVSGNYLGFPFYAMNVVIANPDTSKRTVWGAKITLYDSNMNVIYTDWNPSAAKRSEISGYWCRSTLTYTVNSNAKTFKLLNLPTVEPTQTGVVWNDNGVLKIKS